MKTIHPPKITQALTDSLQDHLTWFESVLEGRLESYFDEEGHPFTPNSIPLPEVRPEAPLDGIFARFDMGVAERIIVLMALCPEVRPEILDMFFIRNSTLDRGFTEFGGIRGKQHGGFLPTAETAMFTISGGELGPYLAARPFFRQDHHLFTQNILKRTDTPAGEPSLSAPLVLSDEYMSLILTGEEHKPDFQPGFPAKRIESRLEWDDLVLGNFVLDQIQDIQTWLKNQNQIMEEWGLKKNLKNGFRTLFFGPPGTGKTLTATLLGKSTGRDVYRVDLSMIVSKYIGETEKNLAGVFDQAENRDWILFFDEADSLFGKRTAASSSNDRHANQEVSYLLQRIEDFSGMIILATNLKSNLDEAFSRRFQSIIHFPAPDVPQRKQLWQSIFAGVKDKLESVNLDEIAGKYELTGGEIINVLRFASIKAFQATSTPNPKITQHHILDGIRREYLKSGRNFTF